MAGAPSRVASLRASLVNAFERLSQRMLRQSGFTKVEVTGKSNDGGIDGVGVLRVNLISFQVLFQCKRWKGSVGAPEVRDFRGAMQGRADKGLIITTGTFADTMLPNPAGRVLRAMRGRRDGPAPGGGGGRHPRLRPGRWPANRRRADPAAAGRRGRGGGPERSSSRRSRRSARRRGRGAGNLSSAAAADLAQHAMDGGHNLIR